MFKEDFKDALRRVRKERGLSQEELADGICVSSTISRIERGAIVPGRKLFIMLTQRLGMKGYCYDDYFNASDLQLQELKTEIVEKLKENKIESAEESLWIYRGLMNQSSNADVQYYLTLDLIKKRILKESVDISDKNFIRAFELGRCLPSVKSLCKITLTYIEILLINNLALFYLENSNPMDAQLLLAALFDCVNRNSNNEEMYLSTKALCLAAISNNLTLCFLRLGKIMEAKACNEFAASCRSLSPGCRLWFQIFATRIFIFKSMGDEVNAKAVERFVKSAGKIYRNNFSMDIDKDPAEIKEFLSYIF